MNSGSAETLYTSGKQSLAKTCRSAVFPHCESPTTTILQRLPRLSIVSPSDVNSWNRLGLLPASDKTLGKIEQKEEEKNDQEMVRGAGALCPPPPARRACSSVAPADTSELICYRNCAQNARNLHRNSSSLMSGHAFPIFGMETWRCALMGTKVWEANLSDLIFTFRCL